jgi:pilus assembly protein CpaB
VRLTRKQAIGVAAAIALVVAVLVYVVLNRQAHKPAVTQPAMVAVVVMKNVVPAHEEVKGGDVEIKQVPREQAPPDALRLPAEAVGSIARTELAAGSVLKRSDVTSRSAMSGLTYVIPPGMRAVTVALDPISGVGGFVFAGDRVDLLATFNAGREPTLTKTIVQDVEVLAMNEQTVRPVVREPEATNEGGEKAEKAPATQQVRSATLAVTPHDAQVIVLSSTKGTIHLVLRRRADREQVELPPSHEYALMGGIKLEPMQLEEKEAERAEQPPWPTAWGPPPGAVEGERAPEEAPEEGPPPVTAEIIKGGEREVVVLGQ